MKQTTKMTSYEKRTSLGFQHYLNQRALKSNVNPQHRKPMIREYHLCHSQLCLCLLKTEDLIQLQGTIEGLNLKMFQMTIVLLIHRSVLSHLCYLKTEDLIQVCFHNTLTVMLNEYGQFVSVLCKIGVF